MSNCQSACFGDDQGSDSCGAVGRLVVGAHFPALLGTSTAKPGGALAKAVVDTIHHPYERNDRSI